MRSARIPLIILIVLLFVAIFLYGSVTDSFTGEGLWHARVQSKDGTQLLDTYIRFEEPEGTRLTFSMYNIIVDAADENAAPSTISKTLVEYTGLYYKQVVGYLYLRPTGLHFPLFNFNPGDKLTLRWEVLDLVGIDAELNELPQEDYGMVAHSSQVVINGDHMVIDQLGYDRIDEIPAEHAAYVARLDELG